MNIQRKNGFWILLFSIPLIGQTVNAQQPNEKPVGYWNVKSKTMGGMQFWSDVRFASDGKQGGWKIQRNSNTGHHRLIDSNYVRQAWGNLAHCNAELDRRIIAGIAKPASGKLVIVMHGLIRTSNSIGCTKNKLDP